MKKLMKWTVIISLAELILIVFMILLLTNLTMQFCAARWRAPNCEKFHKQVFCRKLVKKITMSKFPEIGICEIMHNVCEKIHNESL